MKIYCQHKINWRENQLKTFEEIGNKTRNYFYSSPEKVFPKDTRKKKTSQSPPPHRKSQPELDVGSALSQSMIEPTGGLFLTENPNLLMETIRPPTQQHQLYQTIKSELRTVTPDIRTVTAVINRDVSREKAMTMPMMNRTRLSKTFYFGQTGGMKVPAKGQTKTEKKRNKSEKAVKELYRTNMLEKIDHHSITLNSSLLLNRKGLAATAPPK